FAWLTETMLYRLNGLPDLTFVKLLQLVGLRPRAALPAVVHVTFTAEEGVAGASVPVGTQLAGPAGSDGQPLVFETQEPVDLVVLPLSDVQVFTGAGFTVATEANE